MANDDKIGPTGDFPEGKLNAQDEGALNIAITTEKLCVRVDFGTPMAWFAMPKDLAITFAETILARARELP